MTIYNALQNRQLPALPTETDGTVCRKAMMEVLCREEYGRLLPAGEVSAEELSTDKSFCAGKAPLSKVRLTISLPQGEFSFPISCVLPKGNPRCPVFLLINFRDDVPDRYLPSEELVDGGFGVVSFCYKDVTSDDGDFSDGLAGVWYEGRERHGDDPGKIALWAWAAMRVMDYIQTLGGVDAGNVTVVGHSRLGKTALLAGGLDERFAGVISNNSGCSGAAISRGNRGETIAVICDRFPYWFCPNYRRYAGNETAMPFDQHYLLALTAPRRLYVASSAEDLWADPTGEFLGAAAASEAWEKKGEVGLICPDRLPETGEVFAQGMIGYHVRPGRHYFSRYDWQRYMEFNGVVANGNGYFLSILD
ncbi:MAG: hypothetical protein PHR18_05540 [Oscillospiraceae bacterium]|nr:hypothetical protein [Oscillospiraceae bacterium]MDD3833351.1 hypothetical protein [Oscillospiraceae bacterium]